MSQDELVDILSEQLEIVDTVQKGMAHEKGLLHATVISEVVNSKGEWLLVRQASDKQDAGQWVSPIGGHVSAGETHDEALKREAKEEIGYENVSFNLVGKKVYCRQSRGKVENHLFVVYVIHSDNDFDLNEESVEAKWFPESELKKLLQEAPEKFGDAYHFVVKEFFREKFED